MKYKKCGGKKKLVLFLYFFVLFDLCVFWEIGPFPDSSPTVLHLLLAFERLIDGRLVFCETGFVIFSSLPMSVLVKVSYDYDVHILNIFA